MLLKCASFFGDTTIVETAAMPAGSLRISDAVTITTLRSRVTNNSRSWFVRILVLMVYPVFAMGLYLLPLRGR